jgi:Flp pilus assembly protein TadD
MNGADSRALLNLGRIHSATGRKAAAVIELEKAQAVEPDDGEIRGALEKLRK